MIYLMMDTDYESPSVQYVLEGPDDFDFETFQQRYSKGTVSIPFIDWITRYHGFKHVSYDSVTVYNFEQPKYQRPPKKGTIERCVHDAAVSLAKDHFRLVAKGMEERQKLLNSMKGSKVEFRYDTSSGRD